MGCARARMVAVTVHAVFFAAALSKLVVMVAGERRAREPPNLVSWRQRWTIGLGRRHHWHSRVSRRLRHVRLEAACESGLCLAAQAGRGSAEGGNVGINAAEKGAAGPKS